MYILHFFFIIINYYCIFGRYDIERISLGLDIVKPLDDYSASIEESYNPHPNLSTNPDDDPTTADIPFASRASGRVLADIGKYWITCNVKILLIM